MPNTKGVVRLNELPGVVLILVTIGIFLSVGALILAEIQDQDTVNPNDTNSSASYNATEDSLSGLTTLSSFLTIIAVVIAAAVILGVVFLIRA
jgi:hypothetical protein